MIHYADVVSFVRSTLEVLPFVEISQETAQALVVAGFFLTVDIVFTVAKRRIKSEYNRLKEDKKTLKDVESLSVAYFSRAQMLDLMRFLSFIIGILCMLVVFDIKAMTYLAVAIGALFIIFKEIINSLAMYFYIMGTLRIGEDIKVDDELGELVRIRPLSVQLAGKDPNGEYNGRLFSIPNHLFMQKSFEKQELSSTGVRRVTLHVVYAKESFSTSFDVWLADLRTFLSEALPVKSMRTVGNFKSFAGLRYKLRYDYNPEGMLVVSISFVCPPDKTQDTKEQIVAFIEKGRIRSSPLFHEGEVAL